MQRSHKPPSLVRIQQELPNNMSIKFSEINRDGPVKNKEQILAEVQRTLRPRIPKDMRRSYFYDGSARGDMAHYTLEQEAAYIDEFEDVPF